MTRKMLALAVLVGIALLAAPGWAVQVFNADFQASTVADKTDQANVNAGTSVGAWSGLPDSATQAAWAQGMHVRQDAASSDKAVLFDRFESGPATGGNANLSQPIARDGAVIQMQLCLFRTGGTLHSPGVQSKDVYISGFDAAGNMSFRLVLSAPNTGQIAGPPDEGRRFAYFNGTTLTMFPQGQAGEMTGGGGGALQVADPTTFNGITITCAAGGWTLAHTVPATTGLSGGATAQTWTSGVIPYNGNATEIAYISFAGTAGTDAAFSSGYWVDDLFVDGTPTGGGGEGEGEGEGEPQGNRILSNVYPPFIDVGTVVILTGPEGTGHQWKKNNVNIDGATNRTLVFDPVAEADAGVYTVDYDNGLKVLTTSDPFNLIVSPEGSVPVAGLVGLAGLLGACALGGAGLVRRRR